MAGILISRFYDVLSDLEISMIGSHPKHNSHALQIVKKASCLISLVCALFVASASPAQALSLGRISGTPVLGQPFTGTILATLAPGERLESECVKADLYNGEDKINPNNVRLEVLGSSDSRQIRIRTSQRLTEPLLTVYLEAGCDSRSSRRYTLFVDPVSVSAPQADAGAQADESAAAPRQEFAPQTPAQPRTLAQASSPRAGVKAPARAANVTPRAPRKAAPVAKPSTAKTQPRLTLDLAAPSAAGSAFNTFALTRELGAAVDDTETARRKELRVLRDALMAEIEGKVQPGEFAKRVKELESANEKLLTEATTARAQAAAERTRREQLERETYPAWVFKALLTALAAALAIAAWLWWRNRSQEEELSVAQQVFAPQAAPVETNSELNNLSNEIRGNAVGLNPVDSPDSIRWYERFMSSKKKRSSPSDLAVTMPMSTRTSSRHNDDSIEFDSQGGIAVKEMPAVGGDSLAFAKENEARIQDRQRRVVLIPLTPHEQLAVHEVADITQEAEFFVELGENERAIALLENSLDGDSGLIPVTQLFLLDLYRKTDNQQSYNTLRDGFIERFNAYVPTWEEDPNISGRELADYPRALEQVCRSWRSNNIVPTLEALLVDDTRGSRLGFDLPAYREVIFLYGIAKQLELDSDGLKLDLELSNSAGNSLGNGELIDAGDGGIDLELPIDLMPSSAPSNQSTKNDPHSVDFDLDFDSSVPINSPKK
jgi:pilus assembly protein FimV